LYSEDGSLQRDKSSKPMELNKKFFLVRQPFWFAKMAPEWDQEQRWNAAVQEGEPEIGGLESGFKATHNEDDERLLAQKIGPNWQRMTREHLLWCALTSDPQWKTVAMVCGAGLGKTTNFQYLDALINRQFLYRGECFAVFLELNRLSQFTSFENFRSDQHDKLFDLIGGKKPKMEIEFAWNRLFESGRILFLVDSLDQADHTENSTGLSKLEKLIGSACKVWLSGRSYAFRDAKSTLLPMGKNHPWQFLRVGQLDEPEARQLIDTGALVKPLLRSTAPRVETHT
ncbi:MAG: NACHT domain-containing protein, partial [Pirellula sp.]